MRKEKYILNKKIKILNVDRLQYYNVFNIATEIDWLMESWSNNKVIDRLLAPQ